MKFRSSDILGLAINDGGISCAQVHPAAGKHRVQRLASFQFPPGASLEQPDELGAQLGAFLRERHFTATRAAIGVPAKWLFAQEKQVPPSDEQQALAVLRLQAERLATAHSGELVFDVAGKIESPEAAQVLLVGMARQQVERVTRLCVAAGLKPVSIAPTAVAVSGLLDRGQTRPAVVLSRQGAEVVWQVNGLPRMLRHLAMSGESSADAAQALGSELRRAVTLGPANGTTPGAMLLWDGWGLTPGDVHDLSKRLGIDIQSDRTLGSLSASVEPGALNGAADRTTPEAFLPAVALAVASREARSVDFLHPRLAAPRAARFGSRTKLIVAAAVLGLVLLASYYLSVTGAESQAQELNERLAAMKPDITAAQSRLDRFNYARGYFVDRPPVLDAMREVTLALHPQDPIWATSFSFRDNRRGQLQGHAENQRIVLTVLDRLKGDAKFADVQLQDMREGTGATHGIAFSITFTFKGGQP